MNIVAHILNFSLMIAMPIGLAVYLVRKIKTEWYLFGIGMATFILSQVFHIPFNQWVLNPLVINLGLNLDQKGAQLVIISILYGLSAGLFEEIARYLGYRFWVKRDRNWKSALMYGAGHGGIESILLGFLVLVSFIQAISLRGVDLATVVDADQVELVRAQIDAYWSTPWHLAILGAVERLATICFHLSATVLVLQAFRRKNITWLALAIFWHTLVDAVAVFASRTWNPYITEGIILVFGILSLGVIYLLKSPSDPVDEGSFILKPDVELPQLEIQSVMPSEENLEDSRYA